MSTPCASKAFEQARQLFLEGLAAFESGSLDTAEQCFQASLALVPGRISTLINLAATQVRALRPSQALATAQQVLAIEPDNAEAWLHKADALAQLSRHQDALAAYERVLAANPGLAQAWSHRGGMLREMGRREEAAESFRQALAHGADPVMNQFYLASVSEQPLPPTAPRRYVETLFDDYAQEFDSHLVGLLGYSAHSTLVRHLAALGRDGFGSALDLGCGTGLCAPLLKPMTQSLIGIDLSQQMLDKAQALGLYDELVHADIVQHLQQTQERHDLITAADVFIYVGDLAPVFAALEDVVLPGGIFCFSAECASGEHVDFELLPSLRYAHSERYLRELAARHGFELVQLIHAPIREDQREAIAGMFVYLARTSGPR